MLVLYSNVWFIQKKQFLKLSAENKKFNFPGSNKWIINKKKIGLYSLNSLEFFNVKFNIKSLQLGSFRVFYVVLCLANTYQNLYFVYFVNLYKNSNNCIDLKFYLQNKLFYGCCWNLN